MKKRIKRRNQNHNPKQSATTARPLWWQEVFSDNKRKIATYLFFLLCTAIYYAPGFLQSLQTTPASIQKTKNQFLSWINEDSAWTGHWSATPEGGVDINTQGLSDVDMQITIWAKQGEIEGTIATRQICANFPVVNFVLLRGKVSGDTATVVAWDVIQGNSTDFARLKLEREGEVITVTPIDGLREWFPITAKLGRHSPESGKQPEPDQTYCAQEQLSFFRQHLQTNK
jgi:hypothetical protein